MEENKKLRQLPLWQLSDMVKTKPHMVTLVKSPDSLMTTHATLVGDLEELDNLFQAATQQNLNALDLFGSLAIVGIVNCDPAAWQLLGQDPLSAHVKLGNKDLAFELAASLQNSGRSKNRPVQHVDVSELPLDLGYPIVMAFDRVQHALLLGTLFTDDKHQPEQPKHVVPSLFAFPQNRVFHLVVEVLQDAGGRVLGSVYHAVVGMVHRDTTNPWKQEVVHSGVVSFRCSQLMSAG